MISYWQNSNDPGFNSCPSFRCSKANHCRYALNTKFGRSLLFKCIEAQDQQRKQKKSTGRWEILTSSFAFWRGVSFFWQTLTERNWGPLWLTSKSNVVCKGLLIISWHGAGAELRANPDITQNKAIRVLSGCRKSKIWRTWRCGSKSLRSWNFGCDLACQNFNANKFCAHRTY